MLFTLNNSSITSNSLDSLLRIAPSGTPILLYEDGVFSAMEGTRDSEKVKNALNDHPVYALDADVEARGLKNLIKGIKMISYDGFVELVEENDVVPWL
jgi:tRNA 2-thiouridine synthesizing protein B